MLRSQNGWPVIEEHEAEQTKVWVIPGANRHFRLRQGPAGFVLAHFALYYHEEVDPLDGGTWDEWGWAVRDIRNSTEISNHASGTAMDIDATENPLGVDESQTMTREQISKVNTRLANMDHVIRWGGNYSGRQDAMHFEINKDHQAVQSLAERLHDSPRGVRIREAN